jgi:triacylglycerol lipase
MEKKHPLKYFLHSHDYYKSTNGWVMATLSQAAYMSVEEIDTFLSDAPVYTLHFNCPNSGADGFAISSQEYLVIIFRGTKGYADLKTDMKATLVPFHKFGHVHKGFLAQLDSVWDQISSFVEKETKEKNKVKQLWVTGHSLGGAVALLAAMRFADSELLLYRNNYIFGHIYTFGQPRTGNKRFADSGRNLLKGRYHRAIKANDLVARVLPPEGEYTHFGKEWYIKRSGAINPSVRKATKRWDRKRGFISFFINLLPNLFLKRSIFLFHDHDCTSYVRHFYDSNVNAIRRNKANNPNPADHAKRGG